MSAVVRRAYGDVDQVHVEQVPVPTPADDQVLVQVDAAAIDRGTWHLMTGLPLVVRPAFGLRAPRQPILGRDLAGTIVAVGAEVTDLAPGDEVFGTADGALASLAVASPDRLARRPAALSAAEAAALPVSGLTALQALRDAGRVQPGSQVLVVGASGGVGTYAVQIARALGAEVTALCGPTKAELVRSLGADRVVDRTTTEVDQLGARFDVIIDIAGGRPLRTLRRALTERGTIVLVGNEGEGRWLSGLQRQAFAALRSPLVRQRFVMMVSKEHHADLEVLAEMVEAGTVRPTIDRVVPLDQTADAIGALARGEIAGKVVVSTSDAR
jgi:NADPH:quinone reductase-like Zn-dependent oxidoreductase